MARRPPQSPVEQQSDDRFLNRWSRRKQEARNELESGHAGLPEPGEDTPGEDTPGENKVVSESELQPLPPELVLTDEDMPAIETITGDSEVSGFLSEGVSEALRKRALRRLFHSAVFNRRDGLDDYDEDFTSFEKLGDIVTADMRHRMEMEAQKEEAELAQIEPLPEDGTEAFDDSPDQEDINEERLDSPADTKVDEVAALPGGENSEGENEVGPDTQPLPKPNQAEGAT